jgi:decaprenylphospho-beta-D-erythro-pentofuranosid-2-ulose 2-reductase
MSKVILIGGSSEIGLQILKQLQIHNPVKYQQVVRVSTTLDEAGTISWQPKSAQDVERALSKITFEEGDTVVIAIGNLGGTGTAAEAELSEIESTLTVNLAIPLYSLVYCFKQLQASGGGNIIVLSSVAGFPVLSSNLFYGAMKNSLDTVARGLQESESKSKVAISIVRSGFVPTKLNAGRTPTPFALSAEAVGVLVYKKLGKKIIWTPRPLVLISRILSSSKLLRVVAAKKISRSLPS